MLIVIPVCHKDVEICLQNLEWIAKLDPMRNEIVRLTPSEHALFVDAVRPVLDKHRAELDPALFACLA